MSRVASDRFRCPSLNVFFSDSLRQVIFFRPEMYIKKKVLSFKRCYLLNDFSAFIFHSNVHLLSSTVWHMLICMWSTKQLTMPAYCVAANCNNSQTTPGITMHELLRNPPAVRRKWIKFIQFKRADFLAALHHAHLRREHFGECDFANPMEYRMGFALKLTRCSGTLSKSCLTGSN